MEHFQNKPWKKIENIFDKYFKAQPVELMTSNLWKEQTMCIKCSMNCHAKCSKMCECCRWLLLHCYTRNKIGMSKLGSRANVNIRKHIFTFKRLCKPVRAFPPPGRCTGVTMLVLYKILAAGQGRAVKI